MGMNWDSSAGYVDSYVAGLNRNETNLVQQNWGLVDNELELSLVIIDQLIKLEQKSLRLKKL